MKIKNILILTAVLFLFFCLNTARCESATEVELIPAEEWSWSRGAYNTLSGKINLSDCDGELTICISTDLQYDTESERQSMPVFTSVNGKRIVMTKQTDTVHFSPEGDNKEMSFTVSLRLPEKQHINKAMFTFSIKDLNGTELKKISGCIESGDDGTGGTDRVFYISADIRLITVIIAGAAALVWLITLIRDSRKNNKQKIGE